MTLMTMLQEQQERDFSRNFANAINASLGQKVFGARRHEERGGLQQVWEHVWDGLTAQGKPGWEKSESRCRYQTSEGDRCAIGMLLTGAALAERAVTEAFEEKGVNILWREGWLNYGVPDRSEGMELSVREAMWSNFLHDLQRAHDQSVQSSYAHHAKSDAQWLARFHQAMVVVAHKYGIDNTRS